jgi:serine/threonine protein kinase
MRGRKGRYPTLCAADCAYTHCLSVADPERGKTLPEIGILFDIDELGDDLYGYAAYKIFFEAVDTRQFAECSLSDGDTNATLSGQANQYCIAIEAPFASQITEVKNALSQSNAKGLLPRSSRFLEDALVRDEPLVFAGRINFAGDLVGCQTSWVFGAWQKSRAKHQSSRHIPSPSALASRPKEQETAPEAKDHIGSVQWQIGDIIENRWEVNRILRGGLGIVYIGYDREFRETFAVKTFQEEVFTCNPQIAERFVREATAWINLDLHQNVVQAKYVEMIGGKPLLFLEYITGGDLSSWIGTPRLTEDLPQVLRFAIQFCNGMTHALSKGIKVHRDIKPQNCLITEDNTLKVTDFGLAKVFDDVDSIEWEHREAEEKEKGRGGWLSKLFGERKLFSTVSQLLDVQTPGDVFTRTGMAAGTYTHMAPEQFDDAKRVDIRADIYSFGVMLYQMLTGKLPFVGDSRQEFEYCHKNSRPPTLQLQSTASQSLITHLDSIVQTCLSKDPAQRFKDFDDVRQPLANIHKALTGEVAPQPATGLALDVGRWNDKGLSLIRLGKLEEGLICLNHAIDLDPRYALAWNNKGLALIELAKFEEALLCFERAIEITPRYADAWNNKGATLLELQQPSEALPCFEQAIEINPRYATAWSNKGSALDILKRSADALGCYILAIHYNPHCASAWFNKGLTIGRAGHIQEALFHFEQAKQLGLPQAAQIIEQIRQGQPDLGQTYLVTQ